MVKVFIRYSDGRYWLERVLPSDQNECGWPVVEIDECDWRAYREFQVKEVDWHRWINELDNEWYDKQKGD